MKGLLLILPLFCLFGCNQENVNLDGYAAEVQTAIKDFVISLGEILQNTLNGVILLQQKIVNENN